MSASRALALLVLLTLPIGAVAAPATVVVFDAEVRSAPDTSSQVIATLPENSRVSVSETVTRGFRKVRLQDGRVGYVADNAVALLGPAAPAPQGPPPTMQPPSPPPPPPPAYVYEPRRLYPDPTAFRHVGLYLRGEIGGGYMHTSTAGTTLFGFDRAYGGAGHVAFALGGAVAENAILAGEFWATWLPSPTLKLDGVKVPSGDLTTSVLGVGPSFTWYAMPSNVYFSFTPSVTWVNLSDYYDGYTTDVGVGARVALGKHWWVGPHWGLGLSAWFACSFNREGEGADATWRTYAGGLAFSTSID